MKNNQENNKKQRWSLRKNSKGVASVMLGTMILVSGVFPTMANAESIHNLKISETPTEQSVAPAKYAVIAGFSDKTEQVLNGEGWFAKNNKRDEPYHTQLEPNDNKKGKIGVTYTHIGTFKGQDLDLVVTVKDWEKAGFKGGEYFSFADDHIGFHQGGYEYVDLGFEYVYSDTGKPATDLTGTYMTVIDIDGLQGMGFDQNQMSKIDKVYAPKESLVDVEKKDDGFTYFQDLRGTAIDESNPEGHFTILADGHTLDFRWAKRWTAKNMANHVIDWKAGEYEQYFVYSAEKPVRTELLDPFKSVSDTDEKEVQKNKLTVLKEKYTYDITHIVPMEQSQFFYQSYEMTDELDPLLENGKVTIFNENDKDVTNLFENQSKDNQIKFKAKAETLNDQSFYGHTYRFHVETRVREDADLEALRDVENKAHITKDGKEVKDTPVVITELPKLVEPSVTKNIIDLEGNNVQENTVNIAEQFQYRISGTFPNEKYATELGIYDDVPDALGIINLQVFDENNNDITSEGTVNIDSENETFKWTANNSKAFAGKTIYAIPTVTVKDTINFAEYEEDGNYVFKNTAQLFIDDETIDSKEVKSILEKVETDISKGIVDEDKLIEENEVSINQTFEYQVDTTFANESVPAALGLKDAVPQGFNLDSVVITDELGNDVTEQGLLELDEEKESFKWTANTASQFVGKTVSAKIQVTVKDDYSFTEYLKDDHFEFENTAQQFTQNEEGNEETTDSNTVVSKLIKVDNSLTKVIVDKEGNEVSENEVERGETYKYRISQVVSNEQNIESLTFTDDLEDVLDVVETNVYVLDPSSTIDEEAEEDETNAEVEDATTETENGEKSEVEESTEDASTEIVEDESEVESVDITQVDVNVTDDTKIVSWETEGNLNELKGQTIVTEIDVQIPEDAEISELPTEDDKHVILNTAISTVNETELSSNEVKTLVPQDEEEPIVETPDEPEKEEVPSVEKTPEEPNAPEQEQEPPKKDPEQVKEGWLPHTGTEVNYAIIFGGMSLLAVAGYALYRIRKSQS